MATTIGDKYGALTVIARLAGKGEWLCRCVCGTEVSVRGTQLVHHLYWNRCYHKKPEIVDTSDHIAEFFLNEAIECQAVLTKAELQHLLPNAYFSELDTIC